MSKQDEKQGIRDAFYAGFYYGRLHACAVMADVTEMTAVQARQNYLAYFRANGEAVPTEPSERK